MKQQTNQIGNVVRMKRKYSFSVGMKRIEQALMEYFDLHSSSDKFWFFGGFALCGVATLIGLICLIQTIVL